MENNIKKAIRNEELLRPPMPKDLNARLMKRVEKEVNIKPAKKPLRLIWPWIAAACVAAIIAVKIAPLTPQPPKGELQIVHASEESLKPNSEIPEIKEQQPVIASVECEPQGKQEQKALGVKGNETLLTKKERLLAKAEASEDTSNSSDKVAVGEESVEQEPLLSVAEKPLVQQKPQQKPRVLTERDIPITRPENYKYTEEEIALMRRQANEAYLKWVELELEIANHYYEQTAEKTP